MKKLIFSISLAFVLAAPAPARMLVLPFRVDESGQAAHRWLGSAFSFYLTVGLRLNGVAVFSDEEMQAMLEQHSIRFPFDITKATAIQLGRQNGADMVALGQVLFNESSPSPITVKISLVDVVGGRQTHLPLLRARSVDVFRVQAELLRQTLKSLHRDPQALQLPGLNLGLAEYERFVKGLLVGDPDKKAELLQPLAENGGQCDFAAFELAKLRLQQGQYAQARALLERIGTPVSHIDGKRFLLALSDWLDGRGDEALTRFLDLQNANVFPVETHNDLGVIYMQCGDFAAAEKCLRYALSLRRTPETYLNIVLLLRQTGQPARAMDELTAGLALFPEDDGLLRLFAAALAASEDRPLLEGALRSFLQFPPLKEDEPAPTPRLLNPYARVALTPANGEAKAVYVEARNLFLENDLDGALEKVQQALDVNPFLADNHHLLALIHLRRQQLPAAEAFSRSALFLHESASNYLLLIKVLQAEGQEAALRDTLARALAKFPADAELRGVGANGN